MPSGHLATVYFSSIARAWEGRMAVNFEPRTPLAIQRNYSALELMGGCDPVTQPSRLFVMLNSGLLAKDGRKMEDFLLQNSEMNAF